MKVPPPSPEAQLVFLTKLQRLFAEGDFTATYKYALLIALADLAVELGADDGKDLILTTRQIGDRFIGLYWKQTLPYSVGRSHSTPAVLLQNHGAQAAIVSAIKSFKERFGVTSLPMARMRADFPGLVTTVAQTVSAQPLNYLQNFGGSTDEFLYERAGAGKVLLKPGIAYCLRRFYPLIQQLARSHWIGHIKGNRQNHSILGEADDLESFLFASSRQSLDVMAAGLRKLDGPTCFYCESPLKEADVDHFVPFSRYPRDLAHNLVLAHPSCNRSKSDMLAAKPHLERWLERAHRQRDLIAEVGVEAGFVSDVSVARQVCVWAYQGAIASGSHAWVAANQFSLVDEAYDLAFG